MTDINQLTTELQGYLINNGARLPEHIRPILIQCSLLSSPFERIFRCGEALYAVAQQLNDPGRRIVIATFGMLSEAGMFDINRDNRAQNIIASMKRDIPMKHPTGGKWPDKADDPAPLPEYAAPAPEPASPALDESEVANA